MCFIDNDQPVVYNEKVKKARKPHDCSECTDGIRRGEKYLRIQGRWSSRWDTYKICARCHFDRYRLYQQERAAGCNHEESYCPFGLLRQEFARSKMTLSPITYR